MLVSSRSAKNWHTSSMNPSLSVEKPKSFGSWLTMIVIPRPFMYPTCTSLERRSATNPSLPSPNPISMRPTSTAIIPASAIALAGSPPATSNGVIAAKIKGETDESGPSTSTRDGPKTAYADQAGDGRVETGDGWEPGQLGVRHALRAPGSRPAPRPRRGRTATNVARRCGGGAGLAPIVASRGPRALNGCCFHVPPPA